MTTRLEPSIRELSAIDVEDYKVIRLEALQREPGSFAASWENESVMSSDQWLARLTNPHGSVFGLYLGGEIVGLTGIVVDKADASQAVLVQSYLRPEMRGRGYSQHFYSARIAWARGRGLERVVVGHRESNLASRAAMRRAGFSPTHDEKITWPDGQEANLCHYVLELET